MEIRELNLLHILHSLLAVALLVKGDTSSHLLHIEARESGGGGLGVVPETILSVSF